MRLISKVFETILAWLSPDWSMPKLQAVRSYPVATRVRYRGAAMVLKRPMNLEARKRFMQNANDLAYVLKMLEKYSKIMNSCKSKRLRKKTDTSMTRYNARVRLIMDDLLEQNGFEWE